MLNNVVLITSCRKLIAPLASNSFPASFSKLSAVSKMFAKGAKAISTSSTVRLREIQVRTEENITVVEGIYKESDRKGKVLPNLSGKDVCPLCPQRLTVPVKYTDVLILSQFVRPDGCVYPRYVTGLCEKAQKRLQRLVHQAQRAGLMPELRPDLPGGRERTRLNSPYKWRKYNTYFEE